MCLRILRSISDTLDTKKLRISEVHNSFIIKHIFLRLRVGIQVNATNFLMKYAFIHNVYI